MISAGEAHFTLGGEERVAGPGETVVVPVGVRHSEWNAGAVAIEGVVELRPALHSKEMFEAFGGLAAEGKTTRGEHRRTHSSSAQPSGTSATKAGRPHRQSGCRTSSSQRSQRWRRSSACAPTTTAGTAGSQGLIEVCERTGGKVGPACSESPSDDVRFPSRPSAGAAPAPHSHCCFSISAGCRATRARAASPRRDQPRRPRRRGCRDWCVSITPSGSTPVGAGTSGLPLKQPPREVSIGADRASGSSPTEQSRADCPSSRGTVAAPT